MTEILVLGGGWIGAAVAAEAARLGHSSSVDPPLDPILAPRDTRATDELRRLVDAGGTRVVINACGRVSGSAAELTDANHDFVVWLCDALADTGARLVHIASASEYGDPGTDRPIAESAPTPASGAYATSKLAGTHAVLDARNGGVDATAVRLFNVVDHPLPAVSPAHEWIEQLDALGPGGGEVEVWWPPTRRDFVHRADAALAIVELASSTALPPLVNLCSGVGLSYGELVEALAAARHLPVSVRSLERPGIESVIGDPTLLRSLIGWAPEMSANRFARCALGGNPGSSR